MKQWQVVRLSGGGLGDHAAAWDELLQKLWGGHPLLSAAFVDGLLRHFGSTDEYLCVGKSNVGVVEAMCILRRRGFGVWETFLPSQAPIAPVLMANADGINALIRALPGLVLQLDLLCIDDRFGDLVVRNGAHPNASWHSLSIYIDLGGDFESYWDGRSPRLRKNVRRYERKLAERGLARIVTVTDPQEVAAAVKRYAAIESSGWKGLSGTAIAPENKQLQFYVELMYRFAMRNEAEVHELWLGSSLVASRLMIGTQSILVILKTTYLEAYAEYSPSNVLLTEVVRHAFERHRGKSLEFYTNASRDRIAWSTGRQPIRHASFFRYSLLNEFLLSLRAARSKVQAWRRHSSEQRREGESVVIVTTVDDLPEDALHLLAHAEELSAECGPDWYRNLCANVKFLGDAAQFHVLRRDRVAVAVLPVVCRADFLMGHHRVESLANFYTAIFAPAFAEDLKAADLVPLIRSVLASCIRTASLRFAPLDPTSREFTLLRDALVAAGLFVFPYFCFGNWYLKQGSDWAGYLAGRAGDLRSTVRRMGQRFESESGRLEIVTGPERLAAGIAAFEKCYASSWKGSEPYASFVPGLIETCARRGWLRLGVAWLKEEPIAAQFWIVANGKAEIYKLAYDKKFKRYSPGTLLTAHLLKHVLERDKVSEVDYLVGDERYKQAWMSHRRERWGLVAYNAGTVGGLIGLGGAVLRRLTRALTTPWRTARSGR